MVMLSVMGVWKVEIASRHMSYLRPTPNLTPLQAMVRPFDGSALGILSVAFGFSLPDAESRIFDKGSEASDRPLVACARLTAAGDAVEPISKV